MPNDHKPNPMNSNIPFFPFPPHPPLGELIPPDGVRAAWGKNHQKRLPNSAQEARTKQTTH